MKVILEMEIKKKDYDDMGLDNKPTKAEVKEYLTDSLFEVCEDWVIHGQAPNLKYIED